MPFDGAGHYAPPGTDFPAVSGTLIQSTKFNNLVNDVASALSKALVNDGQQPATASQPMAGFRHTTVGNAVNRNEYAATGQVQDSSFTWCGTAGGTAADITLAPTPAITAYTAGQSFVYKSGAGANAGAMTVTVSALGGGAKAIQKSGAALTAGDHAANSWFRITYDGVAFQLQNIDLGMNKTYVDAGDAAALASALASVASAVPTGVMQDYVGSAAPTGFVLASGRTLGNAASGATERANADTSALFTLLWNSMANAEAPVSTGRGASAAADFAANKTITLPDLRGRTSVGKDNMGGTAANRITAGVCGITGTTLGTAGGDQNSQLHGHGVNDPGHTHDVRDSSSAPGVNGLVHGSNDSGNQAGAAVSNTTGITIQNSGTGGSQNVPPSYIINKIIKL